MEDDAIKPTLRLVAERRYYSLVWTRDAAGVLRCGPLSIVWRAVEEDGSQGWYTHLDGKIISRRYRSESDAQFAAPHLGPVRELMRTLA
jgi:hypothetical protein